MRSLGFCFSGVRPDLGRDGGLPGLTLPAAVARALASQVWALGSCDCPPFPTAGSGAACENQASEPQYWPRSPRAPEPQEQSETAAALLVPRSQGLGVGGAPQLPRSPVRPVASRPSAAPAAPRCADGAGAGAKLTLQGPRARTWPRLPCAPCARPWPQAGPRGQKGEAGCCR